MIRSDTAELVLRPLRERGHEHYGEVVTQTAHALQTAWAARRAGAGDALVVAALLHDIGHLVDDGADHSGLPAADRSHEERGADHLARWFGPEITEPVRLHVAAKRYLCAVDDAYAADLSAASVHSLAVQGGPMTPAECAAFAALPHASAATLLRRADDDGKDPGAEAGTLDTYVTLVAQHLQLHEPARP